MVRSLRNGGAQCWRRGYGCSSFSCSEIVRVAYIGPHGIWSLRFFCRPDRARRIPGYAAGHLDFIPDGSRLAISESLVAAKPLKLLGQNSGPGTNYGQLRAYRKIDNSVQAISEVELPLSFKKWWRRCVWKKNWVHPFQVHQVTSLNGAEYLSIK
jgi:hypothetical protein